MSAYLPFILAGICIGIPCLILGLGLWDCWKISKEHRDERDL
jgi:hypothetical protein